MSVSNELFYALYHFSNGTDVILPMYSLPDNLFLL